MKKSGLQRKLTIGASDDPLELEADRIADQVMATPASSIVGGTPPRIQRFTGQTTGQADMAAPASVDRVHASPGRPLEPSLQKDMGQRFGHDFSQVRVHTDAAAERSAREVNALAYTVGNHIVFGADRYEPHSGEGRKLLAHELAHTVQQASMPAPTGSQIRIGPIGDMYEQQAEATSERAGSQRQFSPLSQARLQRTPGPFDNLSIEQLRKLAVTDKAAAEALFARFQAMSNTELARYAISDPMAQAVYAQRVVTHPSAKGQGSFSNPGIQEALEQDIQADRANLQNTQGITRRAPSPVQPNIQTEGGTIGSARTNIPGYENIPIIGRSPQAGGQVNPGSNFAPPTDPKLLSQTHGHAEQNIADQLEKILKSIPEEQLKGRKVWILIEQAPCSTCAQGGANASVKAGVLVKLSRAFPQLTFEIKSLENSALLVLKNGVVSEVANVAATAGTKTGAPTAATTAPKPPVTNAPGTPAKPPAATTTAPKLPTPVDQPPIVAPTVKTAATTAPKPPTPVDEPPIVAPTVKTAATTSPASAPAPLVEGTPSPKVAPQIQPRPTWRPGIRAAGKALAITLLFVALDYELWSHLEEELEQSINKTKQGAMPWAQRLKREDPSKPVFMRVKVQLENYTKYIPFLGHVPDRRTLRMIGWEMSREELAQPLIDVEDHTGNIWNPGITKTVTYTEAMVP